MARKKKLPLKEYEDVIVEDDLQELGQAIHAFRTIGKTMIEDGIDPKLVNIFDECYQSCFDLIVVQSINCLDMRLHKQMKVGLQALIKQKIDKKLPLSEN